MLHSDYNIIFGGEVPMYTLRRVGQGPVPKELRGVFTSVAQARAAIDGYESKKSRGGKVNGKAGSSPKD